MVRLFQRYTKRKTFLLDGMWKFKTDAECQGVKEKWFQTFPDDGVDMVIPACWNNELGLYDYEGIAWYAATFQTDSKNINLSFHGVTGQAKVYLDGDYLGEHYGGFTGFDFLVKNLKAGEHLLVISVDNTHDDLNTIPLARVDWFHYGGITRSIEVMELGSAWIRDYRIDYKLDNNMQDALIDIEATIEGVDEGVESRQLNIYLDDKLLYSKSVELKGQGKAKLSEITLNNIKLWDIEQPNLYYFRFEIEEDDIVERIGFREIKAENRKILLNGKEIYIQGINRHEEHPDWGFALPFKLMKKDMDIIKNLGCNAIRGSHYPNAEIFLDYCDQEGMLFWEEIPMWGFPEEPLKNPLILQRGLQMHEEMIKRDYHHPCIVIWSMHNEIDTRTQAAYNLTKAFVEKVKSLDKTRLVTYATMHPLDDICYSLVDIVCINQYFGWYSEQLSRWNGFLVDIKNKLQCDNLKGMPIIISEFGAGAIYGDCTFEQPKWTENYQEKYLDYTLKLFANDPDISGAYIWQYCDIRTAKEMEMGRPRSFNNKGLVNEYRKPKMAYWAVQRIYRHF